MGSICEALIPHFRFAFIRPNTDLGALNCIMTQIAMSEADWVGAAAARAEHDGRATGADLIKQQIARSHWSSYRRDGTSEYRLIRLLEDMRRHARDFSSRMRTHAEHSSLTASTVDVDGGYPSEAAAQSILAAFERVGNGRTMLALMHDRNARFRSVQTLWWSDLYDRTSARKEQLTERQDAELKSLAPRLENRVRELISSVNGPVRDNDAIHTLFASVATLGLLHQSTLLLGGKVGVRSMLTALMRLTASPHVYLKHSAALALTKQSVSFRGVVPMISESARGWARAMRGVRRLQRGNEGESDRDAMIASLIEHATLLIPHAARMDLRYIASALSAVRDDDGEVKNLRRAAGEAVASIAFTSQKGP